MQIEIMENVVGSPFSSKEASWVLVIWYERVEEVHEMEIGSVSACCLFFCDDLSGSAEELVSEETKSREQERVLYAAT